MAREERGLDLLAVVARGRASEHDASEGAALAARPASVVPGTHYEHALCARVLLLEGLVDLHRAVEVFLVPPPRHVQGRHFDTGQVGRDGLPLPEGVVVGVGDEIVPARHLALEKSCIDIREGAQAEVEVVGVVAVELEAGVLLPGGFERVNVLEAVAQTEGPLMMEIVAHPHVGRRSLGRDRLHRGMGVEHGHHGEPASVADAQHPHAPVALRGLQEPLHRVVGVAAFVHGLRVLGVAYRPQHHELTLGLDAAADVLEDEDVAVLGQRGIARAERPREPLRVVAEAVGGAGQEDGQGLRGVLRHVDLGVQAHPVAHGHHGLDLVVDERGVGAGLGRHRATGAQGQEGGEDEHAVSVGLHRVPHFLGATSLSKVRFRIG